MGVSYQDDVGSLQVFCAEVLFRMGEKNLQVLQALLKLAGDLLLGIQRMVDSRHLEDAESTCFQFLSIFVIVAQMIDLTKRKLPENRHRLPQERQIAMAVSKDAYANHRQTLSKRTSPLNGDVLLLLHPIWSDG